LRLRRDHQSTYTYTDDEPTAGNYYPINTRIAVRGVTSAGRRAQLTVTTDRSHGGWSPAVGQIEVMLHRRIFEDDARGVKEALNEPGVDGRGLVVRGRMRMILTSVERACTCKQVRAHTCRATSRHRQGRLLPPDRALCARHWRGARRPNATVHAGASARGVLLQ